MGCFADDPADHFHNRSSAAHHLAVEEREILQLEALQQRFGALRDAIPPLKALADAACIDTIRAIEDVAPLLFPHSFYKSFPQELIYSGRYDALNGWLARLTTNNLDAIVGRSFDSIDAWMDAMDAETGIDITHSSGTTGLLSLYPRGKRESDMVEKMFRMVMAEWVDPIVVTQDKTGYAVVWPSYPDGRAALLKGAEVYRRVVASPSMFFSLIPTRMSTDWQLYIIRLEQARAQGVVPPVPSAYVETKMEEAARIHENDAESMRRLLETIRGLSDTKIILAGGPGNLHRIAAEGLAQGIEGFAPGSIVRTFGGLKGFAQPDAMEETIKRFAGVDRIGEAYGMTEVTSAFFACDRGNFHIPPWVVPMIIDPASGALQPRNGRRKGRAAFMDLMPTTFWGGVVSADIIEIDWDVCGCGRTSPHVRPGITRMPSKDGDEFGIGVASSDAVHSALHALTWGIGE